MAKQTVYKPLGGMNDKELHYCPGCTHGIIHKLLADALVEPGVKDDSIMIAPVGCSVLAYEYFDFDGISSAHGRAPAVASGVKRCAPNKIVVSYQGDGDLAAIGAAEIVHAAHRGENITVIYVNNAIYGMTGGQMSPNTLIGQVTTTSQDGRSEKQAGKPLLVSEMLSQIPSAYSIVRTSALDVAGLHATKRAIKEALQNQIDGKGFSLVEVMGTCNIG